MLAIPFLGGSFLSLGPCDIDAVVAHWNRLPPPSLHRRFLRAVGSEELQRQARAALTPPAETIGWYRDGVLRGLAELHPQGDMAEAAFTVEPAWRQRGIGRMLFGQAALRARNRGLARLVVMTTADNFPMLRIAARAGATLERDGTEVIGTLPLAPATPASLMLDAGGETAGHIAALADSLNRMAGAWAWPVRPSPAEGGPAEGRPEDGQPAEGRPGGGPQGRQATLDIARPTG